MRKTVMMLLALAGAAHADSLDPGQQHRYDNLAEKLESPCGKAHSLKTSLATDPSCKRAPFARRYVEKLIALDLDDQDVSVEYRARYGKQDTYKFDLSDTPALGDPHAPVVIVEFFNYQCPHCLRAEPIIEELAQSHGKDVVIYYKHMLLGQHGPAANGARAAIAARRQGKWLEMHHKIFANQEKMERDDLFGYAKELGLDMKRFTADYDSTATAQKVQAETNEGDAAKLEGTPQLYIDGRKFDGAVKVEDLVDRVEEEKAVRRP